MKAGIYVRISRDATGEGLGVTRQLEDCTALAERLGWDIAEVYRDNDVSATSTKKTRPAYRRMLTDLRDGKINALIAWHPDRLYRRAADLGELVEIVQETKAAVATVNAGEVDLSSATGLLVADMLAAIAMYEVRHKTERWSRSYRQGREAGEFAKTSQRTPDKMVRRMFGYTPEGEIVEDEAAIARGMAADILAGISIEEVARRLERDQILTTRGTVWRSGTIRQYLANPRITALSTLKGEIVAEGTWDPILDRETWEQLRALTATRYRAYVPRKALLNGIIFCGLCDHRMITSGASGKRTYRCPNRPGMRGCGRTSGNAEPIEDLVEAYARKRLSDPKVREHIAKLGHSTVTDVSEIVALDKRLLELESQLDAPGIPVEVITRAMARTEERIAELQATTAAAPRTLPKMDAWPKDLAGRARLVALAVEWVKLDPAIVQGRRDFDPRRVRVRRRDYLS